MFDQTFVPAGQSAKPGSLLLSLTLQIVAVTVFVLASIVYTQALPFGQSHALLIAPRPPLPPRAVAPSAKSPARPLLNPLHLQLLPVRVTPASQRPFATVAPTIITGATDSPVDASSAIGDIIGAPLTGSPQPPPARASHKPQPPSGPIRIGGSVAAANLIDQAVPAYPPLAVAARVRGTVEFSAIIGRDGRITNLKLLHGHPLLVRAAMDAVLKWRYRPTLLNGVAVEVATDITVQFNLSGAIGR